MSAAMDKRSSRSYHGHSPSLGYIDIFESTQSRTFLKWQDIHRIYDSACEPDLSGQAEHASGEFKHSPNEGPRERPLGRRSAVSANGKLDPHLPNVLRWF